MSVEKEICWENCFKGTSELLIEATKYVEGLGLHVLTLLLKKDNPEPLKCVLMRRITTRLRDIVPLEAGLMTYEAVVDLISRDDYELEDQSKVHNLESALCKMLCYWFNHHPDAFVGDFLHCFNLLRDELLTETDICDLTRVLQYKLCSEQLDHRLLKLVTCRIKKVTVNEKQRYEKETKLSNPRPSRIDNFRKGDFVEAQNFQGHWYISKVEDISKDRVYVSFIGCPQDYNEWVDLKSLAFITTMTNGHAHQQDVDCSCLVCQKEKNLRRIYI